MVASEPAGTDRVPREVSCTADKEGGRRARKLPGFPMMSQIHSPVSQKTWSLSDLGIQDSTQRKSLLLSLSVFKSSLFTAKKLQSLKLSNVVHGLGILL